MKASQDKTRSEYYQTHRWLRQIRKAGWDSPLASQFGEVVSMMRDITNNWQWDFSSNYRFEYEKSKVTGRRVPKGPWLNFRRFTESERTGKPVNW